MVGRDGNDVIDLFPPIPAKLAALLHIIFQRMVIENVCVDGLEP